MKNKRADIPVTILILGIVTICTLTITSFLRVSLREKQEFYGIGLIETVLSVEEEFAFYKINSISDASYEDILKNPGAELGIVGISLNGNQIIGEYKKQGKTFAKVTYTKS